MIQLFMVFGIGFLSAALLALALSPIVHQRAVRLTAARLDKTMPASVQELRVEKDQMRAQVATSLRRLEVSIEQLTKKNVAHQAEITKKATRLVSLQAESTDKTSKIEALEEKNRILQDELSTAVKQYDMNGGLLLAAQQSLVEKEMELERLAAIVTEHESRMAQRDSVVDEVQSRLKKSETLIASLQKDLSQANDRQLLVVDLHREIDRLESRIETMTKEYVD